MGRSQRNRRRTAVFTIGVLLVAGLAMGATGPSAGAAATGLTYGPTILGQFQNDQYYWNDSSTAVAYSEWEDQIAVIFASDHDPVSGYPYPYCQPTPETCPFHMAVDTETQYNNGSFGNLLRVNETDANGSRVAMASDPSTYGQNTCAAFVVQSSYYDSLVGSGPRYLNVVCGTASGTSWTLPAVAMTPLNGQVDYPSIEAANGKVFLTWTDGKTGEIMLATSSDAWAAPQGSRPSAPATWTKQVVAHTKRMAKGPYPYAAGGYEGRPTLSVTPDGQTVVIAFFKSRQRKSGGRLKAVTSLDGGTTWSRIRLQGSGANPSPRGLSAPTSDAVDGRVAVAWTTNDHIFEREMVGTTCCAPQPAGASPPGTWMPRRTVANLPAGTGRFSSSTVALYGPNQTGVAFSACNKGGTYTCDDYGDNSPGSNMYYTESADAGVTFPTADVIATPDTNGNMRNNYVPNVVFRNATRRFIRWNTQDSSWYYYQTMQVNADGP